MPTLRQIREVDPRGLREHPLNHLVPLMRADEWDNFYRDVAFAGIRVPIEVLADGTVMDGRHRLRAALQLGLLTVPIIDAPLNGDSPDVYMIKAAVMRRHLTDDQRNMLAANWIQEHKQEPQPGPGRGHTREKTPAPRGADVSPTRRAAADLFKVKRRKLSKATTVLNKDPVLAQKVLAGDIALNNAHRQIRKGEEKLRIAATTPPSGQYQVIVIDPPWPFAVRQEDPSHEIANQYEPMSIEAISKVHIPAAEDCILWLWVPNAFLHDAFHVLEAWGFTYHTTLTWAKNFVGLGDWLGGQTEHCLLATKGTYRLFRNNESTLLTAPRTHNSAKPDSFYTMVKDLCPGNRYDMFARTRREGWTAWGADV